jgi:hypothetical protein
MECTRRINQDTKPSRLNFRKTTPSVKMSENELVEVTLYHPMEHSKTVVRMNRGEAVHLSNKLISVQSIAEPKIIMNPETEIGAPVLFESKLNYMTDEGEL